MHNDRSAKSLFRRHALCTMRHYLYCDFAAISAIDFTFSDHGHGSAPDQFL